MDLVKLLEQSIIKQRDEKPREYIGASSVGDPCLRKIWYGLRGSESSPFEAKQLLTFEIGHKLEEMILEFMTKAGIFVINKGQFYQDSELHILQGHVDGVLVLSDESRAILELKTANDSSFGRFKRFGLKAWSMGYYSQVQTYMGMSGIKKAVLLCINKNSSEMNHEWVYFDEEHYWELKQKAKAIINSESPPPKINDTGTYFLCKQCKFYGECHERD